VPDGPPVDYGLLLGFHLLGLRLTPPLRMMEEKELFSSNGNADGENKKAPSSAFRAPQLAFCRHQQVQSRRVETEAAVFHSMSEQEAACSTGPVSNSCLLKAAGPACYHPEIQHQAGWLPFSRLACKGWRMPTHYGRCTRQGVAIVAPQKAAEESVAFGMGTSLAKLSLGACKKNHTHFVLSPPPCFEGGLI
jgi:hypothetical protein